MRLHSAKVPEIATQMVSALVKGGDIECESPKEVELDVRSVLEQYIKDEQEVSDKARDILAARGLGATEAARIKKLVADERKIKLGDDAVDYLLDQLVEMLMHSNNVGEVFVEDHELRRRMRPVLKKHLDVDTEVEAEVRGQLKHVQEGTRTWEIEYKRLLGDIQRRKGLV